MRHIGTLIAAVFIGPLAWILIAFGQDRSAAAFAKAQSTGAFDTGDFVRPLLFLAVAGILVGLIATLRFSPLGAVLTGVVYVLSYVWLLIDPKGLLDLFKRDLSIFGQTADPKLPVQTGTTVVIGALLLVAAVSVKRWQRWPQPAGSVQEPTAGSVEEPATSIPDQPVPAAVRPEFADPKDTSPLLLGSGAFPQVTRQPAAERSAALNPFAGQTGTISGRPAPAQRTDRFTGSPSEEDGGSLDPTVDVGSPPPSHAAPPAASGGTSVAAGTPSTDAASRNSPAGSPWSTPLHDGREDPQR